MPLNKEVIGKKYDSDPFQIEEDQGIFYALAYNEDNDAYFDRRREGGIITPPMYAVKYGAGPTASIIFDEQTGMDFNFVVHYTQEFEWLKPVRPDDMIKSVGEITHIDVRKKGGILGWTIVSTNQKGEKVAVAKWEFFDRSAGSDDAPEKKFEKVAPVKFFSLRR